MSMSMHNGSKSLTTGGTEAQAHIRAASTPDVHREMVDALSVRLAGLTDENFRLKQKIQFLEENVNLLNKDLEGKRTVVRSLVNKIRSGALGTKEVASTSSDTKPVGMFSKKSSPKSLVVKEAMTQMEVVLQESVLESSMLRESLKQMGEEADRMKLREAILTEENKALRSQLGLPEQKEIGVLPPSSKSKRKKKKRGSRVSSAQQSLERKGIFDPRAPAALSTSASTEPSKDGFREFNPRSGVTPPLSQTTGPGSQSESQDHARIDEDDIVGKADRISTAPKTIPPLLAPPEEDNPSLKNRRKKKSKRKSGLPKKSEIDLLRDHQKWIVDTLKENKNECTYGELVRAAKENQCDEIEGLLKILKTRNIIMYKHSLPSHPKKNEIVQLLKLDESTYESSLETRSDNERSAQSTKHVSGAPMSRGKETAKSTKISDNDSGPKSQIVTAAILASKEVVGKSAEDSRGKARSKVAGGPGDRNESEIRSQVV
mmetsp:Transcript_34354/g.83138  ORF Transcript_34354/g.83138 Transcript_34354/m.83138 type:complete len:488 (+) Transcript_34354:179-1642(+)